MNVCDNESPGEVVFKRGNVYRWESECGIAGDQLRLCCKIDHRLVLVSLRTGYCVGICDSVTSKYKDVTDQYYLKKVES